MAKNALPEASSFQTNSIRRRAFPATAAENGAAGQSAVVGKMVRLAAFLVGTLLLAVGILLATQQFLNFPALNDLVQPNPQARSGVGLFGLLIFGTGLSLMLTQVFAERYGARIVGIAFAGTLAALYLFMLIARSTVFDFETTEHYPRDLELSVKCGQENFNTSLAQARQPLVTISGQPDRLADIREAVVKYQDENIVAFDRPPILLEDTVRLDRFKQVGNPDRDLMLLPVADEGSFIGFVIPHVVFTDRDRITLHVADDAKIVQAGSSRATEALTTTRVITLEVDGTPDERNGASRRPIIQAELNLLGVIDACTGN